jgi:hypothetical protein
MFAEFAMKLARRDKTYGTRPIRQYLQIWLGAARKRACGLAELNDAIDSLARDRCAVLETGFSLHLARLRP